MSKYHVKIAQAGETIDGRTIKEEWLRDIAESYDTKTYTSLLWPEHTRWLGNYGQVSAVSLKEEKGNLCLYADLEPNQNLLWENARGQKLFYSLEIDTNFAKTGKAYLVGLGVTDEPASLGLQAHRFSKQQSENIIFLSTTAVSGEATENLQGKALNHAGGTGDSDSFWQRVKAFIAFEEKQQEQPKNQDNEGKQGMDEQFTKLTEQVTALETQFANTTGALAALFTNKGDGWTVETDETGKISFTQKTDVSNTTDTTSTTGGQATPDTQTGGQSAEFSSQLEGLANSVEGLNSRMNEFLSRFEQAQTGTTVPAHTGAGAQAIY